MQSIMKCKLNTVLLVMMFSTFAFGTKSTNLGVGNPKDSDVKIARPSCYNPEQASMIPCSKLLEERYMKGNEGDERRVKETPEKGRVTADIGQIVVEFADGKKYTGSGCRCYFEKRNYYDNTAPFPILLTCAHNFVRSSVVNGLEFCESAYFYEARDGQFKYGKRHRLAQVSIHPKYEENSYSCHSGYDIAVAFFENSECWNNYDRMSQYSTWGSTSSLGWNFKMGSNLYLSGYPGRYGGKQNEGYQYSMRGTILAIKKTPAGGTIVAYKDLDTTPGQSGAPVMIEDGQYKLIFAVHVAGDENSENWGTVITPEIYKWIESTKKDFMDE